MKESTVLEDEPLEPLEPLDGLAACRICLEPGGDMLQPCDCSGSAANVHKECLVKWLEISKRTSCEICLFEYIIVVQDPLVPDLCFSDQLDINKLVIFVGLCCMTSISPLLYYTGLNEVDIYFSANTLWILAILCVLRRVKIMQTLTFWKICLTAGGSIVAFQSQYYEVNIFDWGLCLLFAFVTLVCICRNSDINSDTTQ